MEPERTALPSAGIAPCIENDSSLGSLCEPVSRPRNLLEDESDKRQVDLLKAAAEGVADPSGDTDCCVHLHSEKSRRRWIHHSTQGGCLVGTPLCRSERMGGRDPTCRIS